MASAAKARHLGLVEALLERPGPWPLLGAILLLAFALRTAVVLLFPGIHQPDEIFQFAERAVELVRGHSIRPWEYRVGIRSWILPAVLTVPVRLGALLPGGGLPPLTSMQLFVSLLSLLPIAAVFIWAKTEFGRLEATVTALALAVWYEVVYFSTRTSSEVTAAIFLVPALLLLPRHGGPAPAGRVFISGISLAASVALRVQLAPVLIVVFLWMLLKMRLSSVLIAGSAWALVFAFAGAVDWITWGQPFHSYIGYIKLSLQVSQIFGVSPWHSYVTSLMQNWGGMLVVILIFAAYASFELPLAALVAIAILGAHSVVPHKEFRFIYPAVQLIVLLAALGSARLLGRLPAARLYPATAFAVICALWAAASAAQSTQSEFLNDLLRGRRYVVKAFQFIDKQSACGVGISAVPWWDTPGHTAFRRDIPLFLADSRAAGTIDPRAFDYLVERSNAGRPWPAFDEVARMGDVRVLRRPGGCLPAMARITDVRQAGLPY